MKKTLPKPENTEMQLEILLQKITPDNKHALVDWGESCGKEVW